MLAAVKESICACTTNPYTFVEVPEEECTPCANHPHTIGAICGGEDRWTVAREYQFKAMSSQGAYDARRNIYYTIVGFVDERHYGAFEDRGKYPPERYFLHAVETGSRKPMFEFQMELRERVVPGMRDGYIGEMLEHIGYMIQGLQYDLDSSRLLGLAVPNTIGRVFPTQWSYQMAIIYMGQSNKVHRDLNKVETRLSLKVEKIYDVSAGNAAAAADKWYTFSGSSGINHQLDTFFFSQYPRVQLEDMALLKKKFLKKNFGLLARCEFWLELGFRFWIL